MKSFSDTMRPKVNEIKYGRTAADEAVMTVEGARYDDGNVHQQLEEDNAALPVEHEEHAEHNEQLDWEYHNNEHDNDEHGEQDDGGHNAVDLHQLGVHAAVHNHQLAYAAIHWEGEHDNHYRGDMNGYHIGQLGGHFNGEIRDHYDGQIRGIGEDPHERENLR